jgi:hypothetical protein
MEVAPARQPIRALAVDHRRMQMAAAAIRVVVFLAEQDREIAFESLTQRLLAKTQARKPDGLRRRKIRQCVEPRVGGDHATSARALP